MEESAGERNASDVATVVSEPSSAQESPIDLTRTSR
jgi:hypothetical protein